MWVEFLLVCARGGRSPAERNPTTGWRPSALHSCNLSQIERRNIRAHLLCDPWQGAHRLNRATKLEPFRALVSMAFAATAFVESIDADLDVVPVSEVPA
ncbi:hypothetical protein AAMO2058_000238700 [Amorphochlora amoebiformis]